MNISAELIRQIACDLQSFSVDKPRSAELAAEVAQLNSAVLALTGQLDFDKEPASFLALLERHSR